MKKKILLTLTTLFISLFAVGVTNVSAATYGDLTYKIENGGVTITDCEEDVIWVVIPNEIEGYPVTSIGNKAFSKCYSLTGVDIPDSVISIGNEAFSSCKSLTSINIPDSVTSIGNGAFSYCDGLKSVNIPDSVTSIGYSTFSECYSLTSVNIPDSVISIGNKAFSKCTSLTGVNIPDSVISIGDEAFFNCFSLTSINIPDSVTSIGDYAFSCCFSLTNINVAEKNKNYSSVNGVLFDIEKKNLIQYPVGKNNTAYTIPDSVTSIGNKAFYECTSLTSVNIPDSVTSIGNYAFYECTSLTSVNIGNSVTSIGNKAFYECTSLTSVNIPDSVTSIDNYAFSSCKSLTSVNIPDSVISIGYYAFSYCDGLKTVYYTGSEEQWNNISFASGNSYLLYAVIIYNYNSSSVPEKITYASAKITSALSSTTALKFVSTVTIEGEPEIATFGTTFIPLWLFETGSADVATVSYDNLKYDIQNGQTFGATLGGIPETDRDTVIVGKSFIKDADGNYTWSAAKSASVNNPTLNEVN